MILGGTCDLALTLAERMIRTGLFPTLTFRDDVGRAAISERLRAYEGRYAALELAMTPDSPPHDGRFRQTVGRLDFWVDFAQGEMDALVAGADEADVRGYVGQNIACRAALLKQAARMMLENRRGRMVFISSTATARAEPRPGVLRSRQGRSRSPLPKHRHRAGGPGHHHRDPPARLHGCRPGPHLSPGP